MYERLTDRSRRVMQLANQEAMWLGHQFIGTEDILLGLVKEGSGVAAHVLTNLGIDLRKIRLEVEKVITSRRGIVTLGKLPQAPQAKKVIEYAMREARNLHHDYVGTEHILLGLLREAEGVAAQALTNLGLRLDAVRAEVLATLGSDKNWKRAERVAQSPLEPREKPPHKVEEPPAVCPKCGGSRVVRILWNKAEWSRIPLSGKNYADIAAERATLARGASANLPSWVCLTCEPRWSEVHRLAFEDDQWQLAKERAVNSQDWEEAARLRNSQHELRLRLAALLTELLGGPR